MSKLAAAVADALRARFPCALGFGCPLFVPIRRQLEALTSARDGELSRAWSAGAGVGRADGLAGRAARAAGNAGKLTVADVLRVHVAEYLVRRGARA